MQDDFVVGILKLYLDTVLITKAPKYYIKSTGQEHSGQVYFTEKVGLHDGKCNKIEYR